MNEQAPTTTTENRAPVDESTLQAARELVDEAQTTTDVATVREMVSDQHGGMTTLEKENGEVMDIKEIGQEKFAELGQKAVENAAANLPESAEPWQHEEK